MIPGDVFSMHSFTNATPYGCVPRFRDGQRFVGSEELRDVHVVQIWIWRIALRDNKYMNSKLMVLL